jgi:hypothetical protein
MIDMGDGYFERPLTGYCTQNEKEDARVYSAGQTDKDPVSRFDKHFFPDDAVYLTDEVHHLKNRGWEAEKMGGWSLSLTHHLINSSLHLRVH